MAQVGDVDALIVLAPWHVPENFYHGASVRPSVDEAQRLVEAGKGETSVGLSTPDAASDALASWVMYRLKR